jgi:hypothetical protein
VHAPHDDPVEAFGIMRALDPEMVDAVWTRWRHWFLLHPPMSTRSDVVDGECPTGCASKRS